MFHTHNKSHCRTRDEQAVREGQRQVGRLPVRQGGAGRTMFKPLAVPVASLRSGRYRTAAVQYTPSRRWSNTSLSARSNAAFVRLSSCVTPASSASFFDCETPESDSCSRRRGKQQQQQHQQSKERERRGGEGGQYRNQTNYFVHSCDAVRGKKEGGAGAKRT